MRVVSKRKLREFWFLNAQAEVPLLEWYFKMKICTASNFSELRNYFNSVDVAHGYTVFNVGGNNYRLISSIHYNTGFCYVRSIWTHAQYDKAGNREKLRRGDL